MAYTFLAPQPPIHFAWQYCIGLDMVMRNNFNICSGYTAVLGG